MQISASRSSKISAAAAATVALVATTASASILSKRADCGIYTIISTRGTDEVQGPSRAFTTAVRETLANVPGGVEYDTVYPADFFQQSEPGTLDILNKISTTLEQCPTHKFALLGYSQGATATTEALVRMANDTKMFDSVTAVIVVGNPRHNKGLKSNYDVTGGKSTEESFGLLSYLPGIPERWDDSGKVADVCADGDGVCDAAANTGVGPAHFSYINSTWVQSKAADLMTDGFKAAAASSSSSASATQTSTSAGGSSTSASSPTGTGRPQSDAAMSSLAGSAPAFAVVAAAVSFGALLTIF